MPPLRKQIRKGCDMTVTVFHGSPKKGNTHHATSIFMDELSKCGDISFTEFFLPEALPAFCTGCTLCHAGLASKCPNAQYVTPILDALLKADVLIFATPHYGACSMSAPMKTLLDHLDFMVLHVSPHAEMFSKKAIVITTGAGSAAAAKPIVKLLKRWGVNRVNSLCIRLFSDKWGNMPKRKQMKHENTLRKAARRLYKARKRHPYLSVIAYYHMSKFVLKKYVGEGNYPYEVWKERGYFKKRPF